MAINETCPDCGSSKWDGEECRDCFLGLEYLKCPFCGHLVATLGNDATSDPCACVAALGGDELYWNDLDLFKEAQRRAGSKEEEGIAAQDLEALFEGDPNVSVQYISDAGASGGTYVWYVFRRPQSA